MLFLFFCEGLEDKNESSSKKTVAMESIRI